MAIREHRQRWREAREQAKKETIIHILDAMARETAEILEQRELRAKQEKRRQQDQNFTPSLR